MTVEIYQELTYEPQDSMIELLALFHWTVYSVLQHVSNVIEQQLEIEQHVQLLHLSCLVVKGNARAKLGILTVDLAIQLQ